MRNILYVSAFFPNANAGHAGGRVAFENIEKLKQCGHVDAVVCTSEFLPENEFSEIYIFRQEKFELFRYLIKNFLKLSWMSIISASIIHTRLNIGAEAKIIDLLKNNSYDEIFVDFTQCLLLVNRALEISKKSIKIKACLHDVFAQRMIRSRRLIDTIMTGAVCRQEKILIENLDIVLVLNEKDKNILINLYSYNHVEIKPFIPPNWRLNVRRDVDRIDNKKVIFFGNFNRIENASAVKWFVTNAMIELRRAIPGITLILVGTGSDRLANRLGVADVIGTGFVEDPSKYFSNCGCAIAPLTEGAGVKFKVLELLACGVPVVGTSVACEGIAAQPLLFHSELTSFATEVVHVLQHSGEMTPKEGL